MRRSVVVLLLLVGASPALAADRVKVRLGMGMAEIKDYLTSACIDLVIGGEGEKYITCQLADGNLITANLSPKDRITYSVYREMGEQGNVRRFAGDVAAELGYTGPGEPCMVYTNASLCWSSGTGRLHVYLALDGSGRMVAIQTDDAMAEADK